jgi:FtsP/CotA-like multicopper oxidase with cupredoxin domain
VPVDDDVSGLQPGVLVAVGIDRADGFETRHIVGNEGDRVVLDRPLLRAYDAGAIVSPEFVRYRWYPDAQVGTTYFHDHVNALSSWRHGLFGALIVEPPGSTYQDPYTGAHLDSGLRADIHTRSGVGVDVAGSFREFVLMLSDGTDIDREGRSSGSSIDLRAEPLRRRGGDPAHVLDSHVHGDPATPVLEAYVGDPLVIRTLVPATNDIHTLHIDGHPFRIEPWNRASPPVSTVHIGISERYDLVIPSAGGTGQRAGDYLYRNGRPVKLKEGSWGILRVLDPVQAQGRLRPLPGRVAIPPTVGDICPASAPVRRFDVHAIEVPLPMTASRPGRVYVLAMDRDATLGGTLPPRPLVLHARVGDCLDVALTNELEGAAASFHADQLVADPSAGTGLNVGFEPTQTTGPGSSRTYRLYADPSIGETVALVTDGGDIVEGPELGLYGAVVVAGRDAVFLDPVSGSDASGVSRPDVVVRTSERTYRDVTLFLEDTDDAIGTHRMPYTTKVSGATAFDYRVAGSDPSPGSLDPATPLIEAFAGDPLRIHVLAPVSEQAQVFSLEGHAWPAQPGTLGTTLIDSVLIGALEAITLDIAGAGGPDGLPGDYLYGDHRLPYREAGLWGILRVYEPGPAPGLRRLDDPAFVAGHGAQAGAIDQLPSGPAHR